MTKWDKKWGWGKQQRVYTETQWGWKRIIKIFSDTNVESFGELSTKPGAYIRDPESGRTILRSEETRLLEFKCIITDASGKETGFIRGTTAFDNVLIACDLNPYFFLQWRCERCGKPVFHQNVITAGSNHYGKKCYGRLETQSER